MALTRPRYSQIPDSDYKNSCRIVTTTNVTLTSGAPQTYDGITLVQYDRVLVTGQTDKTQNGIYSVSTLGSGSNGTWVRSKDANANDRLTAGMNTFIEEGTYTGQFWHLLTPGPIVLGVSELIFGQLSGNTTITNGIIIGNLIVGSNIVSNSGNISISTTTGALVITGEGGAGIGGNIFAGGNITANAFYTVNGLFWAGNGLAFSSGLEVSEINAANALSNISTQVTSIRFDKDTGFSVSELNPGNIKVSLGSSFKTWHVPGQADLVAAAEDEVTFFGNGIDITTNPTFPKSITFIANNSVLEANISAYQLYANANAAAQAVSIDTINSNIIAANAAIQTLSANIGTLVGGASAALDTLLELGNALGNNDSFSSTVVNWLSNITANVTAANAAITTLDANVGTLFLGNASTNANLGAYQLYANANIGSIYNQLNTLDANVGTYQLYANANLASIQTQITSITTDANANIASYLTTYTGNISAGNINVTSNITAAYIVTQGVDSGNISGVDYIYANNFVYSANGVSILAAHDANIGTLFLGNASTNANLGAYQTYTNNSIVILDANIGTLFLGNASTNANLGAYQLYANANAASQQTDINSINANLGAYQLYANANIGTLFLGNASTNANLGAYQIYANANAASQQTDINSINANLGAYQLYANANIGTLFLGNASTNANLGAYQTWANLEISNALYEIDNLTFSSNANAAIQAAAINALSANINAFQYYANTKIGTNTNSNLVVASTTDSVSAITGALTVAGGVGIGGNLYVAGNIYASNLTAISISTLSVQDPLLYLTADTTFPYNYDIGFFSHYEKVSGVVNHTGLARDYTSDTWNFFSNAITNPGATVNWSEADLIYDAVRVGDFIVANTTPSTSTSSGALRVAGGAGIAGKLYIANTGDVSANIGTLYLGNISVNANLGAYQLFANNSLSTLFTGNLSTQANLGAFQTYSNATFAALDANIGTLFLGNASTNANIGTLFLGNADTQANLGTLYLGNIGTQANLGSLYNANISTQANIGSIRNQLDTLDANVGSYEAYANVYLGVSTTFTVTDSGFSEYVINGETNPALYLIRGQKYNFLINATGQPFWIKTAPSIGSGDQYNTGVVNNGEDGGVLVFEVPLTAPDVLYYVSQFDAAMTNQLRVVNFSTLDANIGALFLGNTSTQANLGAFQTYANATFTTYSNANVTAYLPIHTGNISAGNIDVTSNVSANKFYTTNGIYWSGNGNPYSTGGGGGVTYTASTTPPVGPAIGDQWYDTADGILYEYIDDGDTDQWVDIVSPTFSGASPIAFTSNITVGGNILITDGIYWVSNGEPYASGGGSFSGEDTVLRANVGAYQLYANANIGTLFLGNISTNANLGAFQIFSNANAGSQAEAINSFNSLRLAFNTYANTKIGTNNNSNLVVVATTTSTNATTGALVVGGGVGIAGALNVSSSGSFGGLIQTTATTAATSTATGALYVAGGVGIVGNLHAGGNVILGSSTTTSNVVVTGTRTSTTTTTGALVVRGGAGIVGNVYTDRVYTTTGIFWSGNNAVFAPPSSSIFTSNVVAASGTASSSTTTGALVVQGGAGISGAAYIGGDLRITSGSTSVGTTSGALVVTGGMGISGDAFFGGLFQSTAGLDSTGTSQGAFTVQNGGGIGVTGNIHATKVYTVNGLYWSGNGQPFQAEAAPTFLSNLVAASGTASVSTTTGALVVAGAGGLGVGGDLNTNAGSTVAGWTVGGLLWAACTTPATSAISGGGLLVSGGARFTGNVYASGNIYLGANTSSNLVANATTTSTSTTTGALVVRGGAGVAGNLYVGSEFVIPGGGKITSSGIANFLEKANVVVSAPAATINVDLSVASVMYWTSNATTNMTANIRGDETTPLNSILSVGQSVTTALFIPNGVSNYYVNSLKIDNTTVTPAYSGNSSPTLGNPDSIDIYSFTILKTADATFKVFATQSQFQHPG